jgi:hypothetical protein
MKKRMVEFLAYLGMGQNKFEERVGLSIGFVSKLSDNITIKTLDKIKAAYPELNTDWLIYGEGEMLKPGTAVTHGKNSPAVSAGSISGGVFGGVVKGSADSVGGDKHVTHHHNGGKDIAIDELQLKDRQMLQTLIDQLDHFHHVGEKRDDYVQKQDEWLAAIIKQSYLRNKENMERIDKVIEQQNEMIRILSEQSRQTQDRADRLLAILEKKL